MIEVATVTGICVSVRGGGRSGVFRTAVLSTVKGVEVLSCRRCAVGIWRYVAISIPQQ